MTTSLLVRERGGGLGGKIGTVGSYPDGKRLVVMRADGDGSLGVGHIMRCAAIAREVLALGGEILFAVSDEASAELAGSVGFRTEVLAGDRWSLGDGDGSALGALATAWGARSVLVDSYAVSDRFFEGYRRSSKGLPIGYVDDLYSFADGILSRPRGLDVDMVLNYMFGFGESDYDSAYSRAVDLLVGPAFAPVRSEFRAAAHTFGPEVKRILVTTGSTNPNSSLERLVLACRKGAPGAVIDVVVGAAAGFDTALAGGRGNLVIHRGLTDLAPLMEDADVAVSAGGSTLYELACAGIPAVAVPIVENQMRNISGFSSSGCGIGITKLDWHVEEVSSAVSRFLGSSDFREKASLRCLSAVDGRGAARIAKRLIGQT